MSHVPEPVCTGAVREPRPVISHLHPPAFADGAGCGPLRLGVQQREELEEGSAPQSELTVWPALKGKSGLISQFKFWRCMGDDVYLPRAVLRSRPPESAQRRRLLPPNLLCSNDLRSGNCVWGSGGRGFKSRRPDLRQSNSKQKRRGFFRPRDATRFRGRGTFGGRSLARQAKRT